MEYYTTQEAHEIQKIEERMNLPNWLNNLHDKQNLKW